MKTQPENNVSSEQVYPRREHKTSGWGLSPIIDALDFKEKIVDKDLQKLEARLNRRIDEVKNDLKKEIEQVKIDLQQGLQNSVSSLKWFIGIFITSGLVITGVIVTLIVKLIN